MTNESTQYEKYMWKAWNSILLQVNMNINSTCGKIMIKMMYYICMFTVSNMNMQEVEHRSSREWHKSKEKERNERRHKFEMMIYFQMNVEIWRETGDQGWSSGWKRIWFIISNVKVRWDESINQTTGVSRLYTCESTQSK